MVVATVEEALASKPDVLIDYTHPDAVKGHVEAAIAAGVASVIGTSGLTGSDYEELDGKARAAGVGIIAAGNFSITAALAKHFAGIAAQHIPHWEILDYSHAGKPDVPSGTGRELAEFLGEIAENQLGRPIDQISGPREARGASIGGSQVHSIRLPSFVLSFETIFGLPNERLSIRHDSGSGAEPYVNGTLMAAERVVRMTGLVRGLDTLLFGDAK
jgi:4-hydroxy-tetrahydrodipicolinate reductase